jgi:dolichyl-phosphate-mannose--protein O-mannosyl transferase
MVELGTRDQVKAFTTADTILVLLISVFSFATHLWRIEHPDYVVFDEVHFGNFTNWYTRSEHFFDIHPPLGKLVMFFVANFSEYGGDIDFEGGYGKVHKTPDFVILRLTPAIFSAFCPPLIYLAMRFSSFSCAASFVTGFLLACDTSMLTEHRFTLSDGMLHFFTCLFLAHYSHATRIPPDSSQCYGSLLVSGVILGCACACKNTAWGLMPYMGIVEFLRLLIPFKKIGAPFIDELIYHGAICLGPVLGIHFLSFGIHWILLPFHGPGSDWLFPSTRYQLIDPTVIETQIFGKRFCWPDLYLNLVTLFISMHVGNMKILSFHPYQSRPINWPLLTGCFVAFWSGSSGEVDCIGNVFVYYPAFFSLFLVLFAWNRKKWNVAVRFVLGWVLSFFPFWLVPRSMYLYHYLIPLVFGCMSIGACLDLWLPKFWVGFAAVGLSLMGLFGFWLWSPLCYGTPHLEDQFVFWTSRWRYGDAYHQSLAAVDRRAR